MSIKTRHVQIIALDAQDAKTHELGAKLAPQYEGWDKALVLVDLRHALANHRKVEVDKDGKLVGARDDKAVTAIYSRAKYLYKFISGEKSEGNASHGAKGPMTVDTMIVHVIKVMGEKEAKKVFVKGQKVLSNGK